MGIVPPDPHATLNDLRASLARLREFAVSDPRSSTYLPIIAEMEAAVAKLEEVTKKAP